MHTANELLSVPVATGTLAIAAKGLRLICRKVRQVITADKLALMGILGPPSSLSRRSISNSRPCPALADISAEPSFWRSYSGRSSKLGETSDREADLGAGWTSFAGVVGSIVTLIVGFVKGTGKVFVDGLEIRISD